MDKLQYDRLLKPLIEIYDEIELDITRNILKRLKTYDSVEGSLEWYLEKLTELGTFRSDNLKVFKKNKKEIEKELEKIIEASSRQQDYLEILNNYYEKGLIEINPTDLYQGEAFNNIIDNALKDVSDITDLIKTKALEGANDSYKKILSQAYIETASEVYTYQESIRRALKEYAKEGIQVVHYTNGKTLSIEAVVRRDVITRTNQLVGDIDLENAKSLGTNLVYVDQHLGARVRTKYMKNDYEAHAEWQGKVYMIEGSNDKYPNFFEKTGYKEMLGLKGINCYHGFRAFFEWEEIPKEINKEKNEKEYELLQKQRAYERKIRRLKRKKEVSKDFDKEKYKKVCMKLKNTNKEYNSFIDENNLRRDYSREYVETSKKSQYRIEEKNYLDVTNEWLNNANANSHKIEDRRYFEKDGIRYDVDGKNVVLDYSNKEKEVAEWLEDTFGGEIYMLPRINNPEGISTADYLWNDEYWDLKEIKGISKQTLYHAVYKKKSQSSNFIFDVSMSKLNIGEFKKQINSLYDRKDTEFMEKIILKKENEFFIYKRKQKKM